MSRGFSVTAQHLLPFEGRCVVCGREAELAYPGPYIPLEYPTREWFPCCLGHRRNVGRMAAWRRLRAGQAPRMKECGSTPRRNLL